MVAIGIDLGTTNSCVAVYQNGAVEIIVNEVGDRTTPSCVSFTDKERLIGKIARDQRTSNPTNTVYGIKRLIGRRLNDPSVIQDRKYWSFKVCGTDDRPVVEVEYTNRKELFSPEQISAMILEKMKSVAETFINAPVRDAVVTVPAYFNNNQRQATKDAARIAGLNLLHIINEPTAAAIAYGHAKSVKGKLNILVFDLGGGTLDVSIMCIRNGVFDIKATSGNTHLGGDDFDNRMVDHFVNQFSKVHGDSILGNRKAMMRLLKRCEAVKRDLSFMSETRLELDSLFEGHDLGGNITRVLLEELNNDLFESILGPIQLALDDAQMTKNQIDEILLVGGSTRIPKIKNIIQNFFNGKKLNQSINPDEAVAHGAAVQAAILSHDSSQKVQGIRLLDVTLLSLGIEVGENHEMSVVIKRNTRIPTTQTREYETQVDNQESVSFAIFEGERPMTCDNYLLGTFVLEDITLAPKGDTKFEVTFHLEVDGILEVSALETGTANRKNITIAMERGRLSEQQINKMIEQAERLRIDDENRMKRLMSDK